MSSAEPLVTLLADGALHSGERLAEVLGVSRTAVWKVVTDLRERGIPVLSVDRRGYKLEHPVELLQLAHLRAAAARRQRDLPVATEVIFELGSTNEYLHAAAAPAPGQPRVVFAELQTAGRGRRGRSWLAPFGAGVTFSIGWSFADTPADLSALSLAMGVCVARELRAMGAPRIMLKWPNDIVFEHRKLGGLLAQLRVEAGGPAYVVIGLGLNLQLPPSTRSALIDPVDHTRCGSRRGRGRARSQPATKWRDASRRQCSTGWRTLRAPASRRLLPSGPRSTRCVMYP